MVNFAKLHDALLASMNADERAAYDRHVVQRTELKKATRQIDSHWTWTTYIDFRNPGKGTRIQRSETKQIGIRIERTDEEGREVLQFVGGPTGYEAYAVNDDFFRRLLKPNWNCPEHWFICAGTAGRYPTCRVDTADIIKFLELDRPDAMRAAMVSTAN